jgi:hypothetical protein
VNEQRLIAHLTSLNAVIERDCTAKDESAVGVELCGIGDGEHHGRGRDLRDRGPGGTNSRRPGGGEGARCTLGRLGPGPSNPGRGPTDCGAPALEVGGWGFAGIARATGLSRPTIYRILGEECNASSRFGDGQRVGRIVCGTGQVQPANYS